jgi:hypothetical protein
MKIGAAHKKKVEDWLRITFEAEGIGNASVLARQLMLLLDGSFALVLLHRDPSYMETAGEAARALVQRRARRPIDGPRRKAGSLFLGCCPHPLFLETAAGAALLAALVPLSRMPVSVVRLEATTFAALLAALAGIDPALLLRFRLSALALMRVSFVLIHDVLLSVMS